MEAGAASRASRSRAALANSPLVNAPLELAEKTEDGSSREPYGAGFGTDAAGPTVVGASSSSGGCSAARGCDAIGNGAGGGGSSS